MAVHQPGCARLGIARLNAFRLNVYEAVTHGWINGVNAGASMRIEGAAVQHILNDEVDTASVRVHGIAPVAGQVITIAQGDTDLAHTLFAGRILETVVLYESRKENVARDLACVDPTWLMQRRKVLATYSYASASLIAYDLLARFCRGISATHVVLNLPVIDTITFTNESLPQCLTAVCERIGGSWYVDFANDLHLFLSEDEIATPITDATNSARALAMAEDLSQVATRVIGRGGGVGAALDLPPGMTELPIDEGDAASWYSPTGGLVEVGTQVVSYTGVKGQGGVGALIGTGTTPTSALTVTGYSGTGLGAGTYQYAQTFANAAGETRPGPLTSVLVGGTAPTLKPITARSKHSQGTSPQSGMVPGGSYSWKVALLYGGGAYALGPATPTYTVDQYPWELGVGVKTRDPVTGFDYLPSLTDGGIAQILQVQLYRTTNGGATWRHERAYFDVPFTTSGWLETANGFDDGALGGQVAYPTGPIASFGATKIAQPMPVPPSGFTAAHVYRTAVNGSQLKRLVTGINTSVDYVDTTPDGSLGANAPTSDTTGIVADASLNVTAGAVEILVTSTAPFTADGGAGWARIGDLLIRYTGTSASKLTGLPPTGVGSLTATVRYGATILVQPRLVGIPASGTGALTLAVKKGDTVTIRIELEDAAAVALMADRLKLPGQAAVTADGVIEDVLSDSRAGLVELLALVRARLTERKDPRYTLTFETRDASVQVGRLINVTISQPPIAGTFRIQRITFSEIAITGGLDRVRPLRRVEATSKLFTFSNLLRQLRGREGGVP